MFWIEGYAGEDVLNENNSPVVSSQGSPSRSSSLSDYGNNDQVFAYRTNGGGKAKSYGFGN